MKRDFEQRALQLSTNDSLAFELVYRIAVNVDCAVAALASGHHAFSPGETYRSAREQVSTLIDAFEQAKGDCLSHIELLEIMLAEITSYSSVA